MHIGIYYIDTSSTSLNSTPNAKKFHYTMQREIKIAVSVGSVQVCDFCEF
jgi:hypothetical protein